MIRSVVASDRSSYACDLCCSCYLGGSVLVEGALVCRSF